MNVLTQKDKKWWWEEAQQKAFDELKGIFTSKPVITNVHLLFVMGALILQRVQKCEVR